MLIYGKEVDFKISRLSNATKMDQALKKMDQDSDKIAKMGNDTVGVIGAAIEMFRSFFINATNVDVLEGCDDLEDATKAYYDFLDVVKEQKVSLLSAYNPDKIE